MNHFKFLSISVSALVALNLSLHPLPAAPVEPPAGFTALFNSTDLTFICHNTAHTPMRCFDLHNASMSEYLHTFFARTGC